MSAETDKSITASTEASESSSNVAAKNPPRLLEGDYDDNNEGGGGNKDVEMREEVEKGEEGGGGDQEEEKGEEEDEESMDPVLLKVVRKRASGTVTAPTTNVPATPSAVSNVKDVKQSPVGANVQNINTNRTVHPAAPAISHIKRAAVDEKIDALVNAVAHGIAIGIVSEEQARGTRREPILVGYDMTGPGAYALAPHPEDPEMQNANVNVAPPPAAAAPRSMGSMAASSTEGLVEAQPTEPTEVLAHAHPYDNEQQQMRRSIQQREKKRFMWASCIVVGIFFAVLAVVLSVLMGRTSIDKSANGNSTESSIPSHPQLPTMAPSSPTDIHLNEFVDSLPGYSQRSLEDPFSPQSQALEWLLSRRDFLELPTWRMTQLYALACFFYSFAGPNWPAPIQNNWLDEDISECDWYSANFGVLQEDGSYSQGQNFFWSINPCQDNVTFVDLALGGLNLSMHHPTIPPEISLLTSLKYLHLFENGVQADLSEFLPAELYQLSSLEEIGLDWNNITGTIPTQLANLTTLKSIILDGNIGITGTIPTELSQLTNVSSLILSGCSLSGTIPSLIWENMTFMGRLGLDYGQLTGSIPSEFGLFTNMTKLSLEGNQLTGTIPTELGNLENLTAIAFGWNQLSGTIPSELGLIRVLEYFGMNANHLSGSVPQELFDSKIHRLNLFENALTGSLSTKMGQWSNITELWLDDNMFSGMVPSELGLLAKLVGLGLDSNPYLTGSLPNEIGSLVSDYNLSIVFLNDLNSITGTIPEELCVLNSDPECMLEFPWGPYPCTLTYNCTAELCGCDCLCSESATSANSTLRLL